MPLSGIQINEEDLKGLLDLKWLRMESVTKIDAEPAVKEGENYGSVMKRLSLTGEGPGGSATRRVVMKMERACPGSLTELTIFKREIQVYRDVLPKMKEVIDAGGFAEILWPVCCGVRNYDVILLEDLVEAGYSMRNRRVPLSASVANFTVEQLAKFHALSIVAVRRKLIDPNALSPNVYAINSPLLNSILSGGLLTLADSIKSDTEWSAIVPKLKELAESIGERLSRLGETMKDKYPVINHGDCWTNNILFKYGEDLESPKSLRFVDFQGTHYGCFAWDLTYLMHTSMSAVTRRECSDQLVRTYLGSLGRTLRAAGEEPAGAVPSEPEARAVLRQMAPFALAAAFSLFPITINTMDKPWDFDKIVSNQAANSHSAEMYENEVFKESFRLDAARFKGQGLL